MKIPRYHQLKFQLSWIPLKLNTYIINKYKNLPV